MSKSIFFQIGWDQNIFVGAKNYTRINFVIGTNHNYKY